MGGSSNRYSFNFDQYLNQSPFAQAEQDADQNDNPFQTLPQIKNDESALSPYYASKMANSLGQTLQSKLVEQIKEQKERKENATKLRR